MKIRERQSSKKIEPDFTTQKAEVIFFSSEEPERTENITYQIPAGLLFR